MMSHLYSANLLTNKLFILFQRCCLNISHMGEFFILNIMIKLSKNPLTTFFSSH